MSDTPAVPTLALAQFKPLTGPDKDQAVAVHFNPASLQYSVSNTMDTRNQNNPSQQFVSQTTGKLTMDLVFDTTRTGEDVRGTTDKMAKLLRPFAEGTGKVPPRVEFGWGVYRFIGIVEQYKETLDFFAAGGVPLRASINLTLSSQELVFDSNKNPNASVDGNMRHDAVSVPDDNPSSVANQLGDPRAARALAALNGSASLRFGAGAALSIGAGVSLGAAAAFSVGGGGGLSLGAGAGAGIGIGGGISGGIGAGISAGVGLNAGAGIGVSGGVGLSAGAGLGMGGSIGAGAGLSVGGSSSVGFGGLHASSSSSLSISSSQAQSLLPAASSSASATSSFNLGGAASGSASSSLRADVGAAAELNARIGFD